MLKSGITLVEALDILSDQSKSPAFQKVVIDISNQVKNGSTFAKALSRYPKIFTPFYTSLIEVGENSGTLDEALVYLSEQLSKDYSFRKKVKGALMYPVIVLVAALIVGISVSLFVLPKLIDLFSGFDVQLPWTTQLLLGFATIMRDYGIILVVLFVAIIVLCKYMFSTAFLKPFADSCVLRLPIFGEIIKNSELATLCRSLGVMLRSGLPITTALEIEKNAVSNSVFKHYIAALSSSVSRGKSLSGELSNGKFPMVPPIAQKMIGVGEKTGKLDEALLYLASFFEEEVDDATKNLSTTLEPFMLLLIGLIVAFIAMSIISPIYELTGSIKR